MIIFQKYKEVFAENSTKLGITSTTTHKIDTGDSRPINHPPYRVFPIENQAIVTELKTMVKNDVIEPCYSPWASPVVLVKKKNGTLRFCVDYRKINEVTKKDVYPLPLIEDTTHVMAGMQYFSVMDLKTGYWQVAVDEKDRDKTAFITPHGLYRFKVMPMGLTNAPATFQRLMDMVLAGFKWKICLVYLDDIVVFSKDFESHLSNLAMVFKALVKHNLKLKLGKCYFFKDRINYLGHVISQNGVEPDFKKIKSISLYLRPTNINSLRQFLGICTYYRKFVRNFFKPCKNLEVA